MGKVLFIHENDIPTVSITKDVFSHVTEAKNVTFDFAYLTKVTPKDVDESDVITFIRPMNILAWRIASYARRTGHLVAVFCDDDLLNLPKNLPSIPWRRRGFLKSLQYSDVIWSSSNHILNKYVDLTAGKRMVRADTIIRKDELFGVNYIHNNSVVKIVYAAGKSHYHQFEQFIKPIIPDLVSKYGDSISFTFVGVRPDLGNIPCNYVSEMSLLDYRKYMKDSEFDIGLAPVYEDDFSKCKYFNKFIEYTTQGIFGIYTDAEPYSSVVKNGINGFLAQNSPEAWFASICKAIDDKGGREQCVASAIAYLQENHSEKSIIERMLNAMPEMRYDNHKYDKCPDFSRYRLIYYFSRLFDWLYLLLFYFFHNGYNDVKNRISLRIKKANVYGRSDDK